MSLTSLWGPAGGGGLDAGTFAAPAPPAESLRAFASLARPPPPTLSPLPLETGGPLPPLPLESGGSHPPPPALLPPPLKTGGPRRDSGGSGCRRGVAPPLPAAATGSGGLILPEARASAPPLRSVKPPPRGVLEVKPPWGVLLPRGVLSVLEVKPPRGVLLLPARLSVARADDTRAALGGALGGGGM